jgi:hypothetical protein
MAGKPAGRCTRFLCLAASGIFAFVFTAAARAADDLPTVLYQDYRGRPLPAELTLVNVQKEKLVQVEPEGVRIKIPKTWIHPFGGVGFRTASGFKGDFEVTTTFEILQAEAPPSGYGVGVRLFAGMRGGLGASICRLVKPGGKQVVACDTLSKWVDVSPCTDTVGRLRFRRTGTTLSCLWAPGTQGDDFQEKQHVVFGTEDIEGIWLVALTGRTPSNVDVRFRDLRVRGQRLDDSPVIETSGGWLLAALLIGLAVFLAFAVNLWLYVRRRRGGEVQSHG